jgi:hypothetical protein
MVVGVTVVLVGMILFRLWFLQILSGHTSRPAASFSIATAKCW